ncbi:chondroadherin-like protein isoform X1 [Egretta garzetta]|uniref:chondroadherin-like protein isoform X1 n=2 Tax=Egretta garzetta TaxID=188379 RepID=UPI00163C0795|nr:chondroadherin-like protein isoform X1 [Egretta garzetta]XP_035759189.1 chondroadherin-like protein isoform X1 [Egretta garzetta]
MVSANPAGALAGPPLRHARVWPPVRRRAGDVWVTALSPGVLYPSSFPPPPSPPPVFLALSGERCWESDTTGPIQRSLLQGEQTPAQEFGSHWTAAGGGETTLSPLFLLPLEEQVLSTMRLPWGLLLLAAALALGGRAATRCPAPCVCDNLRAHVLCLNGNLTAIPSTIPQLTKKLDLWGNSFTVIPVGAFLATPYLTHLDLQRCKVERLEEGAFRGLGRLVYLNLASNSIALLYQESLDGLSSLQQLILEGNRIEEIQPGAFGHLGSLTVLDLRANALVYLPDMVFQGLQVLRWLRLSHNALHVLSSEAFTALPTLRRLSLDHNELQALPGEALARLDGTTQLDLGHNPITYMPEEALAMASLKHLFLDHAALQDVAPNAFARSPQLRTLDLRENQLRGLPPLAGIRGLVRVSLAGNPLLCSCLLRPFHHWLVRARVQVEGACAAPPTLCGRPLDSLRPTEMRCSRPWLPPSPAAPSQQPKLAGSGQCPQGCTCSPDFRHGSCENRDLREIPRGFPGDTRLLDLRRNAFGTVPPGAFPGLKELVSLHLQSCSIGVLRPGALRGLESLVYLYLTDNRLSTLVATAFEGAPRLAYLDLDRNAFTHLPTGAFQLLPNLMSLHLQHNAIGELAEGDLAGARGLRWLYLAGNAIGHIAPAALAPAKLLEKLHLEGNRLVEVPTPALRGLPALSELKLSQNPIKRVGDSAFLLLASSLQHLYLDNMGLEQISPSAFTGLGPKIRSLYLESNKMSNIPDMSNFTGLEILNLRDVPFHCDCQLLPLRRWIDKLNLRVGATCGSPAEARGLKVKLSTTFQTCPDWGRGKAGGASPDKTKAVSKLSKKKRSGKSPARGFKKSRA